MFEIVLLFDLDIREDPFVSTDYLTLWILFKIYGTKNSFGAQFGAQPVSKTWICHQLLNDLFSSEVFTRSFLNIEQPSSPQGLFYLNKAASIIQLVTVMSVICIHDLTCLKSMKCGIYRKGFYQRHENIVCQE